jgi:hypothetical protein
MSMAKRVYPRWTTPAGVAVWPKLIEPSTKFSAEGVYELSIRYEDDAVAKQVAAKIREFASAGYDYHCKEQGKAKLKVAPLPFGETEEGKLLLRTKLKARVTKKDGTFFEQRPSIFDSRGRPLTGADIPRIGGGSIVKACVEVFDYYTASIGAGLSLRLRGVQLITLVEYGEGGDASSMGFTTEEEGYVAGGESFELDETAPTTQTVPDDEEIPF